ncbi:ERCC4 domain-containing protein [Propionicicella superfundia]|uniref:ERCC4 domain-containing protein n=1 Tax=Propionicicella superfundia TaxID=348582 RepID=UPI00048D9FEA|nr:histone-like nucleoid-structuring protein Lsr2 [Propionicicella superfundia]
MPDDFLVVKNPEPGSTLPYLVRLPLGEEGVVLKTREVWPRTAKVYCHRTDAWPADPEVVDRAATVACVRRGAAIDLVLERGRENRSQFILTSAKGREVIFWQTARTSRKARPDVRTPSARAAGTARLEIVMDVHERYGWTFAKEDVQVTKRPLAAGDYAVEADGSVVAVVERKSLDDLVSTLTSDRVWTMLAGLAAVPRAAVVVEERYSRIFGLTHVRPAAVADRLGECQARFPAVPIVFAETRPLAQQWAYRFLAACLAERRQEAEVERRLGQLGGAPPPEPLPATAAEVRSWARAAGIEVSAKGRVPAQVLAAYARAHPER